jgi:hypothetical protein
LSSIKLYIENLFVKSLDCRRKLASEARTKAGNDPTYLFFFLKIKFFGRPHKQSPGWIARLFFCPIFVNLYSLNTVNYFGKFLFNIKIICNLVAKTILFESISLMKNKTNHLNQKTFKSDKYFLKLKNFYSLS